MIACKHITSDLAHMIQLFERNHFLVRCDLEDAVGWCVEDGTTGAHMFFAQFLDDFGARSGLIADHLTPNSLLKVRHEISRKAIGIGRQRFVQDDSGHFPVTCCTVLACSRLCHAAIGASCIISWWCSQYRSDVSQANASQVR